MPMKLNATIGCTVHAQRFFGEEHRVLPVDLGQKVTLHEVIEEIGSSLRRRLGRFARMELCPQLSVHPVCVMSDCYRDHGSRSIAMLVESLYLGTCVYAPPSNLDDTYDGRNPLSSHSIDAFTHLHVQP